MCINKKILFVDDNHRLLKLYQNAFRESFEIETVSRGELGLEAIRKNGTFAVILSDLCMPGMDGITFLAKTQEYDPNSMRIMITGHANMKVAIDAVNEGHIFSFLTKPCPFNTLLETLKIATEQYLHNLRERQLSKKLEGALFNTKKILKKREKQLSLQKFLFRMINHDFNRDLLGIKFYIHALKKKPNSKCGSCIEYIALRIDNELEIINMINELEKVDVQIIPIMSFFQEYKKNFEYFFNLNYDEKSIFVTWDIDADGNMAFNRCHLKRILDNLITNAINYNGEEGEIHVYAGKSEKQGFPILEITVSNNGQSISKINLRKNIFKTRWRSPDAMSHVQGCGLGLSYIKYILNKYNGEIKAESLPGRKNRYGTKFVTTFIVNIPIAIETQVELIEKKIKSSRSVLVIGAKGTNSQNLNQNFQYVIEDLRLCLGIKKFVDLKNIEEAMGVLSDFGIVISSGSQEKNKLLIEAAKKFNTVIVILEDVYEKVTIITGDNIDCIPTTSFHIFLSNLFPLKK